MPESETADPIASTAETSSMLARYWYVAAGAFVVGAALVYAFSKLFLPCIYESTGAVYVDRGGQSGMLAGLSAGLGMQSNESGYVATLMQSDTMMRRVSQELNLVNSKHFKTSGPNREEKVQRQLKKSVNVKIDRNGAVTLTVKSKDPKLSADIVNHILNNLGKLFKTKSQKKAEFLENQIKLTQQRLKDAERQMLKFQQSNKIALIDEETKTFIQQLGAYENQLIGLEVQLEQVKSQLADEGDLEELVKLRVKKRSLEASRSVLDSQIAEAKKKLAGAPQASLEYARISRDVMMQTSTLERLTEQYQLATLTQHGEDGDYQVIDWGQPRYEPVGPRSAMNAVLGGIAGFCLACLWIVSPLKKPNKGQAT